MNAEDDVAVPRAKTTRVEWVERWKDVVAAQPDLPGVWRRRDGGFHVRARTTDPRTNKLREVNRELPNITRAKEAYTWLQGELERIRSGSQPEVSIAPAFHAFAADVFKRKVDLGKIRSAAGRAKWESVLETHLYPAFGDILLDQLRPSDIKTWQSRTAAKIKAGDMAPTTANTILSVLRQVTDEAAADFDLRDPMRGVDLFDTREHNTYTEEEPNSLAPADVPRFLGKLRELHPEHFAFAFLGFTTGLRPSSLRPLRRDGATPDIKWDEGLLLIRRSQTLGNEVMETTKTDLHQRLTLPRELMKVLRWHVDSQLLRKNMRMSELLFPSVVGGFRSRSCLDKPFHAVSEVIELGYNFTPRGMRRTYQDLARAAGIHDVVTRAISGHATPEMQHRYSTPRGDEVKHALSKVAKIATCGADIIDLERVRKARKTA